jgi:hypothetical protein
MRTLNSGLAAKLDGLLLQLSKQEASLRKDFDQLSADLSLEKEVRDAEASE